MFEAWETLVAKLDTLGDTTEEYYEIIIDERYLKNCDNELMNYIIIEHFQNNPPVFSFHWRIIDMIEKAGIPPSLDSLLDTIEDRNEIKRPEILAFNWRELSVY
jgi:hypothetical protein